MKSPICLSQENNRTLIRRTPGLGKNSFQIKLKVLVHIPVYGDQGGFRTVNVFLWGGKK